MAATSADVVGVGEKGCRRSTCTPSLCDVLEIFVPGPLCIQNTTSLESWPMICARPIFGINLSDRCNMSSAVFLANGLGLMLVTPTHCLARLPQRKAAGLLAIGKAN